MPWPRPCGKSETEIAICEAIDNIFHAFAGHRRRFFNDFLRWANKNVTVNPAPLAPQLITIFQ